MNDRRPIRVVRVMARLNIGGPARQAVVLGRGLDGQGFASVLVHGSVGAAEGSLEPVLAEARIRAVKIPELGPRVRPWSDLVALARLTRLMFREQPDVVHTHTAKAGALGRVAAALYNATRPRSRNAAVIHTFHGHVLDGYFGLAATRLVRGTERALMRLTDRVVAISTSQKADLCQRYAVSSAERTVVVELGLDLAALLALEPHARAAGEFGASPGDVVFGYVGRFVAIKDLPTLIRAFARVSADVRGARLILVGDGDERRDVETLVRECGIGDRVCLAGWRTDLVAVYGAIDVGVLSSRNEGTPVALIEAMAAGRPVVATDAGGVADVVAHERTGLVVPRGDVEALAAAMTRLARDAALRRRLGDEARRAVAPRFTAERLLTDMARLYREAIAERRGHSRPA
jgi:glycosyltransferase involved in cell wall biosynthesis